MRNSSFRLAMLAGAAGLFFAASASAQDGDYGPPPGPENVPVIAPHIRVEPGPLNGAPEKVSMSVNVRYDDLDLATRDGADELRWRIRATARDVCRNLAAAYPFYALNGTNCYKTARDDAMVRANEAIQNARDAYRYRAYYGYED
ncbi:MAG TPA: UrcA family protein [Rhizomicrobium sp.]|nr:UrcA family protein [Rhizomicrobium sp.]